MYSRFRGVEACYPFQFCGRGRIPFTPSPHGYQSARAAVDGHDNLQHQKFGHNGAEWLPTSTFPTSNLEATSLNSPTSSGLPSNPTMSEVSFGDEYSGHSGNFGESLDFSRSTEFMLPPHKSPPISKDIQLDQNLIFNSMASPKALDSSFGMCTLLEPANPCQNIPAAPACFDSLANATMWNQGLPSSFSNSIMVGDAGNWIMPPDGGNRPTTNFDFLDCVDDGAVNNSLPDDNVPNQPNCFYNPGVNLGIPINNSSSDVIWTHTDLQLSSAASLTRNEPGWALGNQRQERESLSHSFSKAQSLCNTQQRSERPLESVPDYPSDEIELDVSARRPKSKVPRELRRLKPKSTPSVLGIVAGGDNKSVPSRRPQKPGCRSGQLNEEVRKGAFQMRLTGACLACKMRKSKCSGRRGEACKHCLSKKVRGRPRPVPCVRGPLPELEDAFCPTFAFGHLELTATEDWIKESQVVMVGKEILINFSSGPFLSSMSFVAREIWQPDPELLQLPDLSSDTHDRVQGYASIPSLPYILSDYNIEAVGSECLRYINTISKFPVHLLQKLDDSTPAVVWRSLEAVWRFLGMNLAARQAYAPLEIFIKLYWTLFVMGRDMDLTTESVTTAIENLRNPSPLLPNQCDISAKIIARQVKTGMALIYKDLLRKVLEGLETAYKSNTRLSAAIAFCANVLLCFIVGELQIVFAGLAIHNISKEGEDPVRETEKGVQCSQAVDEVLTFYSWTVFFNNGRRYNPIKDAMADESNQDHGLAGLADDFHSIMRDLEDDITDLAAETGTRCSKTTLDYKQFTMRNPGKHICQYLKHFY